MTPKKTIPLEEARGRKWSGETLGYEPATSRQEPFRLIPFSDFVAGFVAPEYLVADVLQRRFLYSLTGQTGSGKTAIAITLALAVASGHPFAGHAVHKGRVAYFAGENPDDIRARCILTAEAMGLGGDIGAHFFDRPADLTALAPDITEKAKALGGLDLVLVDTAAAYFQGDDENSNSELGGFARDLRTLCELPGGPCVLVLCHPTKSAHRSNLIPRGGGAFIAEVDGNLSLWNDEGAAELHWQGKLRGPGFEPVLFNLETRTSPKVADRGGREIPSVVAVPMTDEAAEAAQARVARDEDSLMLVMQNHPSGSIAGWCADLGWTSLNGAPHKSKVARLLKRLADDKLVTKKRGRWELTADGKKEAAKVMK